MKKKKKSFSKSKARKVLKEHDTVRGHTPMGEHYSSKKSLSY